ncbi:MAG: alpha/beta fold hydrolase [Rhizobiaceae bacterium]
MQHFTHSGFDIAYMDRGEGEPVLLIHGFASNVRVNWDGPGWFATLNAAGYRVIALDNRGHGETSKSHDKEDYKPSNMASDAVALLDHLGLRQAHVMGYSMGARISAFLALEHPHLVKALVFGGLGIGLVEGVGDWDPIADALLVDDPATITHARGLMFRKFADQTKSDRLALAACIQTSRVLVTADQAAKIHQPTLIAVGTKDDIAGDPFALARLMPDAKGFAIEGRDHMLAVGDRAFKAAVLAFLAAHD